MSPGFPGRSEIEAGQLEQLRSLVAELFPANAFYTRKLTSLGVTFDVASLADFSARFPLTAKQEIVEDQQSHPPHGTNLTYPLDRYTRFHQTSGSTGTPIRWLDTNEDWEAMLESWAEIFRNAGVSPADRVFFAFSFGPFIGFWLAYESAAKLGALVIPSGGLSSLARLKMILDNGATTICCTPTYAVRLGETAQAEGLDLKQGSVRRILVAGEPGGSQPAVRARIESLWPGAKVFDHHGMTEVGPVTYQCPAQPGVLHVIESAFIAEIIDPSSGKPVSSDQAGELVLTTLRRVGSPLLRYRTGDWVKTLPGKCTCGRYTLALEGGILGRVDDMLIVRGVNVYPAAVENLIQSCGGVAEYRVHVTQSRAMTEMRLEIEPAVGGKGEALRQQLEVLFRDALSLRVPIQLVEPGTLPRFEMKARRWIRE